MLQISHNMFLPTWSLSKSFIFPTKVWPKSKQMNCLGWSLFLWFYAQLHILTPTLPPKALFQVHSDILVNDSRKMQVIFINMSRLIWIQFQSWAPSTKLFLLSLIWFHRFSLWLESTTRSIFRIAVVALSLAQNDLICDNRRRLWNWRQSQSTGDARRRCWPQRGSWQREPERWVEDAEYNENGTSGNGRDRQGVRLIT